MLSRTVFVAAACFAATVLANPALGNLKSLGGMLDTSEFIQTANGISDAYQPMAAQLTGYPQGAIERIVEMTRDLQSQRLSGRKSDDKIDKLVGQVTKDSFELHASMLSGEHRNSRQITRHSQSADTLNAANYIESVFKKNGLRTSQVPFLDGYAPNVIGVYPSGVADSTGIVVLGGHFDCRNADIGDIDGLAPGANDDGSGTAGVLAVADAIGRVGPTFNATLIIAAWAGEEQGLIGSRAMARALKENGHDVWGAVTLDMTAYLEPGKPESLAFVTRFTTPEMVEFAREVATRYVPELQLTTSTACCSDHQSFDEVKIPNVGFVERGGYTVDPRYHHVLDKVYRDEGGYSLEQGQLIGRAGLASVAVLAQTL